MALRGNQYALGNNGGRPTKYKRKYCAQIIEFCKGCDIKNEPRSLVEFAAHIGVSRGTLNEWSSAHQEFLYALETAKAYGAAFYAKQAREITKTGKGSATMCVFALKNLNKEDFTDISKHELTGKDDSPLYPEQSVIERFDSTLAKFTKNEPD